jgi:hypothetical protein
MESLLGGLLFLLATIFLVQRKLGYLIVWLILTYLAGYHFGFSHTISVVIGIVVVWLVSMITAKQYENFATEEGDTSPDPVDGETVKTAASDKSPHVDIGTTILHAYRNLSPEQIGGMRKDTRELLELQKELMGSLGEMKPAIEQGAELLKTFSTFFGKE